MQLIEEIAIAETTQKWIEPFRNLLDEIYWPGYAEDLASENPDAYGKEYFYFLAQYA